jgi:acyl carrier protein
MSDSTATIEDRVIKLVCNNMKAKPENITMETSFVNDLGADSLDTVELVMELEEEFGLTIPDEDAQEIQTVGNAVEYIKSKS